MEIKGIIAPLSYSVSCRRITFIRIQNCVNKQRAAKKSDVYVSLSFID
jgi:hypothetical protein